MHPVGGSICTLGSGVERVEVGLIGKRRTALPLDKRPMLSGTGDLAPTHHRHSTNNLAGRRSSVASWGPGSFLNRVGLILHYQPSYSNQVHLLALFDNCSSPSLTTVGYFKLPQSSEWSARNAKGLSRRPSWRRPTSNGRMIFTTALQLQRPLLGHQV